MNDQNEEREPIPRKIGVGSYRAGVSKLCEGPDEKYLGSATI